MHQHSTRRRGLLGLLLIAALLLAGCGSDDEGSSDDDGGSTTSTTEASDAVDGAGPKVVVSTTWVGGIVQLAGADDITVIAPSNVTHPPDYEPTASDVAAIADADYVVLAGFEGFADRMKEAAGSDAEVLEVMPAYDPEVLHDQIHELGETFGTDDVAEERFEAYEADYEAAAEELQATTAGSPQTVVAQMFVVEWADFAGYEVAGTYGPEPTTAEQVADLAALDPTLVFENSHMGGGDEVAAAAEVDVVDLINFPGDDLEMLPVVEENAQLITDAIS